MKELLISGSSIDRQEGIPAQTHQLIRQKRSRARVNPIQG